MVVLYAAAVIPQRKMKMQSVCNLIAHHSSTLVDFVLVVEIAFPLRTKHLRSIVQAFPAQSNRFMLPIPAFGLPAE